MMCLGNLRVICTPFCAAVHRTAVEVDKAESPVLQIRILLDLSLVGAWDCA